MSIKLHKRTNNKGKLFNVQICIQNSYRQRIFSFFIPSGSESHLRLCTVQFWLHNESLTTKINGISQNNFSSAVCDSQDNPQRCLANRFVMHCCMVITKWVHFPSPHRRKWTGDNLRSLVQLFWPVLALGLSALCSSLSLSFRRLALHHRRGNASHT